MGYRIAFCISVALLLGTIGYVRKRPKNRLMALTIAIYLMLFAMVFPFGLDQPSPVDLFRHFFTSLVDAAQVFSLDGNFNEWQIEGTELSTWFKELYTALLAVLYAAAPIFTAGFLATAFRPTRNWLKWKLDRSREVWIFSEPSEKALLFAGSVLADESEDVCAVFCDVDKEHFERIAEIGAIALTKSADELDGAYLNRKPATVLFMSADDERNLEQASAFVEKRGSLVRENLLLYCFTSRPEAGLMLNAIVEPFKEKIGFRRIAENRAVVYQELLKVGAALNRKNKMPKAKHPGRLRPAKVIRKKRLHFLIVGCGWIGEEMLKALLWCFVRYEIVIDVVDKVDAEQRFYRRCPGLRTEKRSGFRINFISNEDVNTFDLSRIEDAGSIDYVFVALGNDIANLSCAVYLRQAFRRLHRQSGDEKLSKPEIHVVINNPGNRDLRLVDHGISYDIQPFNAGQNYYTTQTLLAYGLEKQALLNHLSWELYYAEGDIKRDPGKRMEAENRIRRIDNFVENALENGALEIRNHARWRALVLSDELIAGFYRSDYDSNSSRARAVFDACHRTFGHSPALEHRRWIMYMLTEGYQYGKKTDHVSKLHRDIRKPTHDIRDQDLAHQRILDRISK